ncbi:MAG: tail fiber domain-containing protein, partial [Dysgonamonadaceae bacterium]|nr:tail fiber domain-containing protein [Dysgonamonadaceae bacterium]
MKKIFFVQLLTVLCVFSSFAQIKITSSGINLTGNIGIKLPSNSNSLSALGVGTTGSTTDYVSIGRGDGYNTNLHVTFPGSGNGPTFGIRADGTNGIGAGIAITGDCYASNTMGMGSATGVLGHAGGVTSGKNHGVLGVLSTTGNSGGAGVVGIVTTVNEFIPISGQYAGYFSGDVKVTGQIINQVTLNPSDIRYKKDIMELNSEKSLKDILAMKPVEYRLKQEYVEYLDEKGVTQQYAVYDEKSQAFQNKHYGLIAQELQKLYPDLVYTISDQGYLGINYTEIIPMLIQSIQELNKKIEVLEQSENTHKNSSVSNSISTLGETFSKAVLYQNTPNPFTGETEIRYELPETVQRAYICIFDMQGKMLKKLDVSIGSNTLKIKGSELQAGMYLYSLITDGKEIDTKKMILT